MINSFIIANRYQTQSVIGEGGNAVVYLGFDKVLNKSVAIKLLKSTIQENSEQYQRYLREIKTASTFTTRKIVKVFDVGVYNDHPFIVMEYIKGQTAKELTRRRGYLEINEAVDIILQVCDALDDVHKYNIIHRDIKPQNILVKSDGRAILADFGTAFINEYDPEITSQEVIVGSPHYLDPEIAKGNRATIQSDIYSLGITMFELLCGRLPYTGNSATAIAAAHIKDDFPDIRKYNSKITQDFVDIIEKACQKKVTKRYKNINEFKADLLIAITKYKEPERKSFWTKLFKKGVKK